MTGEISAAGESPRGGDDAATTIVEEDDNFAAGLAALSRLSLGERTLNGTLIRVAECAAMAIPGAEGAGLAMVDSDSLQTIVATNQFVSDVDAVQYDLRQGPCLTAASGGQVVVAHSLDEDQRWPQFGARAAALGAHSALSIPLATPEAALGSMNIYARSRNTFDDRSVELGRLFAIPATIAVQNAQVLARVREIASRLRAALAERVVINRAIGVLIEREGLDDKEGLRHLDGTARTQNQSVREAAEALLRQVPESRSAVRLKPQ